MADVSVIGTGAMGSALVEGFASAGSEVTVWNRTAETAAALAGPRVRVAGSLGQALAASPLTIITVSDHELARALVVDSAPDLSGTVLASASFATADQASSFDASVRAAGGRSLDLAIVAYPDEVRNRRGFFLISGDRAAYEAHRDRFELIGQLSYVNDSHGAAYLSELALLVAYLPMAVGLLQGLRICEQHDIPVRWFHETVLELYPAQIRSLLERVTAAAGQPATGVEATVDVWRQGAAEYAAALRELGLDAGMYDALHRLFTAASEAGYGDGSWTRIAVHVATE